MTQAYEVVQGPVTIKSIVLFGAFTGKELSL